MTATCTVGKAIICKASDLMGSILKLLTAYRSTRKYLLGCFWEYLNWEEQKDEHLCFMMWQEHELLDLAQAVTVKGPKLKKILE